jgi:xylose isomerase
MEAAQERLDAAFEFMSKLGAHYYCFHDRDLAPEGGSVTESEDNLGYMVDLAKKKQHDSGIKLLWGTANVFSHPRYTNGAATNPDFAGVAHVATQIKGAIDATIALGGENYVFWGGREGYYSLLNTDTKREIDHMAMLLTKACDYGRKAGFKGPYLIEPKPFEPTKHQYDYDVAAVANFIRTYGLFEDFRINIEHNHATLAGHTIEHEVRTAFDNGLFGSIDINQGDPHNGWDTDEFIHDVMQASILMLEILTGGGLAPGGLNFDAKVRRSSTDLDDLFIAHVSSMDTLARGLLIAHDLLEDSDLMKMRRKRYASFDSGDGAKFEKGELGLSEMRNSAAALGEPERISGKQELYEAIINRYI